MKRSSFFPIITLLTFLMGVASVFGYGLLVRLISAVEDAVVPQISTDEVEHLMPNPMGRVSEGLRVTFLRTEDSKGGFYAVFLITNESPEAVGYFGFSMNDIDSKKIKQGGKITNEERECGTGESIYTLRPGESSTFSIRIPNKVTAFEAGFEIYGERTGWKTAWSETISPPE